MRKGGSAVAADATDAKAVSGAFAISRLALGGVALAVGGVRVGGRDLRAELCADVVGALFDDGDALAAEGPVDLLAGQADETQGVHEGVDDLAREVAYVRRPEDRELDVRPAADAVGAEGLSEVLVFAR